MIEIKLDVRRTLEVLTFISPQAHIPQMFQIQPTVFPAHEVLRVDDSHGKSGEQVEIIPGISIVFSDHRNRTARRDENCY